MPLKTDLTGKRFGKLTVLAKSPERRGRSFTWICQCDCGRITHPIVTNRLLHGRTRSCGCLRGDFNKGRATHGLSRSPLYRTWRNMKNRCLNTWAERYKHYGGRGITVCDEWLHNFEAFYDWAIANGYADGLSLDRIDVNGNYCPENCRWADETIQANNKSNNLMVEINGEIKTFAEWSRITGIRYDTLCKRYRRGDRGEALIREVNA